MKIFILLFLGLNLSALAQEISSEENKYLGYIYQQATYQLDDPQGDILLLWSAKQVPKSIVNNLKGKSKEHSSQRAEKIQELLLKYPQYQPKPETKNVIIESYVPFNATDLEIELEGHEAPFQSKNIILMLKQIITEEYQLSGILPETGSVHQWSPEIKKEIRKKFPVFSRFSKLLIALSRGVTSYFMLYGYAKGSLKAKIVGKLESAGSHVLGRF